MSPTSYQTAPPRVVIITTRLPDGQTCAANRVFVEPALVEPSLMLPSLLLSTCVAALLDQT